MKTLRDEFALELLKIAYEENDIVVLDCDMGRHTKLKVFSEYFEKRFYQIGIAEQNAIGIAAGMAKGGKIPIVSSFAMFICGRAWEQIRHSVLYNNVDIKIFATHCGLSDGEDGGTHQCIEDIALMMTLPEIEIFSPGFPTECKHVCKYITRSNKPAYIRVGRSEVKYDIETINLKIGQPIIKGNLNASIAIISTGEVSQEVYELLEKYDDIMSIHIGCLRPLDTEFLKNRLMNISKIIVVEECSKYGGLASILYMNNVFDNKIVKCMNVGERFGQTGTEKELRKYYGLSVEDIEIELRRMI